MQHLFTSILVTISILILVLYNFITACRIIGKEKWVEKFFLSLMPNMKYNENSIFMFWRPMLLHISLPFSIITSDVISRIPAFIILLRLTCILAGINFAKIIILSINSKKDKDDKENKE